MPKFSLNPKQIIIIGGGLVLFVILFFFFTSGGKNANKSPDVNLLVWGFEPRGFFEDTVIRNYIALRSNVKIKYVQVDRSGYGENLLNALAAGQGPDVFPIGNRDLPKELDKLAPAPVAQFNLASLRNSFPSVVESDFTASGSQIYALPSYIDTLVLLYNKDSFDQASIVSPPKAWDEFLTDVSLLRSLNDQNQIVKAAAAIGSTEKTVDVGIDLLNLLMLQNGAKMTNSDFTTATFASEEGGNPGLTAFNFYLQFANAASPYYTWNDSQPDSLQSFASGETAMAFNYQSAIADIKNKNPFLNFGVAPVPQVLGGETISYPGYFGWAVSKQNQYPVWAWDFVIYLTTDANTAQAYLSATGRPPALRSLIAQKLQDPDLGVFAKQALTARSWHEADNQKIHAILNSAISAVLSGQATADKALRQAQDQVSLLMKPQ